MILHKRSKTFTKGIVINIIFKKKTQNIPTPIAVSKFVDAYDLMTKRKRFMHVHIIYNTFIFIFKGPFRT